MLLILKRSGPVLIVTCWCFDESSIPRNGQSRPCGRNTLIEIDLIRLEAVFVEMLCTRWFALYEMSIFFKDGFKVGFKVLIWWLERNMLVCFFRLLTKNVSGFAFITKFSKIFMWTSPGAFDVLKVDVLNLFTSPGAFEILCQVFQNELWRIFLLPDIKLVEIWRWCFFLSWLTPLKLTLRKCRISSQILQKFFKLLEMICCLCWRWWWWINWHGSWKRIFCCLR